MGNMVLSASTACFAGSTMDGALEGAAELGFRAVELTLWGEAFHSVGELPGFWWRELGREDRQGLRRRLEAFDFVDGHLPFVDCRLVGANKYVQELCRELLAEALAALAWLGGKIGVFHVEAFPARSSEERWRETLEGCRWLGDAAAELGVRVAVETGYPSGDAFARLVAETDHPAVGACVDVGHLAASVGREKQSTDAGAKAYNDYLLRLAGELGAKLWHFHVHDVRYVDWRDHREAGTGMLDFAALGRRLRQSDFAGRLVFELEEEDTLGALGRSKAFLEKALAEEGRSGTKS